MCKSIIAIFFSLLFVALITAPTIVMAFDADYDVSIIIDSSEEEEKEGKESLKDVEIKVFHALDKHSFDLSSLAPSILGLYLNTYSSKHKELLSPPPDYYIL